jgi:hypothetical protein
MKQCRHDCLFRLLSGALLNVALIVLWCCLGIPFLGDWERPFHFHFWIGCLAAAALVVSAPVLWRGTAVEIVFAFLIAMASIYWLYRVFEFWQMVRWGPA